MAPLLRRLRRHARLLAPVLCLLGGSCLQGCRSVEKTIAPSHYRQWAPDQAVLPYVDFAGNQVTVYNVRYCKHFDADTYIVDYYDKSFDLRWVRSVDFFMIPFQDTPSIAHTMLSFEIADPAGQPEYLALSVEVRKEEGESYAAWKGSARQYELMYVLADERDVVLARAVHRGEPVYLYRSTATPEQSQRLLTDVLARTNELASRPEFYDTLSNNCTTNIVRHINRIKPNRIALDMRVLLPGYSDRLAFDEGLIERFGSFEATKQRAYVNPVARQAAASEDFSLLIRQSTSLTRTLTR